MKFALRTTALFDRQFKKLERAAQARIAIYLKENVDGTANPRAHGKPLKGRLAGGWRYRVGDYRIICEIQDAQLIILALEVGPRRDVYRKR